ncbi:type VI secretion system tip protein TssI/VgrG, partial [Pseudomonas sp. PS02288]|uniref:type VI secretion system tip protein TssI/VgrG n=1 Tax=Pseudomonas sp. PS02288 TaxID=2991443 RepID=UPI00249C615B
SEARSDAQPDLEDYDYPGRFVDRSRGKHLAKRALERHRADYQLAEGDSDQPTLSSGHFLALAAHPRSAWNQLWLLDEVLHEGKQPQVLEESIHQEQAEGFTQGYRNHFSALPWDVPYRPPLNHPKPRILGSQSAVVTGPPGEEIHCDEYGRVKVQFFWDRHGQADDRTSCWLRVSSSWAGDRYGGIAIPRVGMEVLVSFLEGDPDQPLISGCLYHKEHVVPYALPANKTRSVFKTLSSPGGAGYNELRIEDRKGQEQIYLHAQRDWDENIEHDQRIRIGHERHDTVEANSYTELKAEEHRTTHADRRVEVRADDHLGIGGSQHVRIGNGQFVEAGQEIHLGSGFKVVLEAGSELTLKGGGSWIKLDASGICINGATVKMNSGGAPGRGASIRILGPLLPGAAAVSQAGEVLSKPLSNALATVLFSSPVAEEEEEEEELEEGGITLRIGVFFDGTGNNRSNSESVAGCHARDVDLEGAAEDIRRFCAAYGYDGLGRSPNNSYGNDTTNVARLYDLYVDQSYEELGPAARQASFAVYMEGIGTSSGGDDSLYSQVTGLGETGVLVRVKQAPDTIQERVARFVEKNPDVLIRRIEFDLFGFSRGAAAARHFANDLLKGPGSLLASALPADSPMLAPGFAWQPKVDFGITFVGLFDTVAGIFDPLHGDLTPANALNPGLNLRLAPGDIGKVVQFVARDEHRYNFALIKTDNDIVLPGAHSDIGGGYLPQARERLLLSKPRLSTEKSYISNERSKAYLDTLRALDADLLPLQRYGLELEIVSWAVNSENNYRKAWHQEEKRVYAAVRSDRQVAGGLSLVYLRAMREAAVKAKVPFKDIPPSPHLAFPVELESIFQKLQALVLGESATPALSEAEESLLYRHYIHLSAHWNASLSIVFANRPTDSGVREEYPNE